MIPVFQSRYAAETFGNCFEACVASILELPLAAVPDRAALVDADAWADTVSRARVAGGDQAVGDLDLPDAYSEGETRLRAWLADRGIAWLDLTLDDPGGLTEREWLDAADGILDRGYWIAHTRAVPTATGHATVWRGRRLEHNPHRSWPADRPLGPLHVATLLVAGDPALLTRTLDPLPDVAGLLDQAAA